MAMKYDLVDMLNGRDWKSLKKILELLFTWNIQQDEIGEIQVIISN